ncbi:MAG: hypothetical protein GXX99_03090 [Clostridiales bacterium]|nr:hypothetical protein [Clostridiales bacterium]
MPDFKEMYLKMFSASEQAITILIEAQRACEELYIPSPQPELEVVSLPTENKKGVNKK